MVVYLYRCAQHGVVDVTWPMGTAPSCCSCPTCGTEAPRVFAAPRLSFGSPTRRALIEQTERSQEVPEVVGAPPPRARRRPVPANPALVRLPRL